MSDGGVHDMAHLVPILGRFDQVSAFATKRHSIHVVEDTLSTTCKLANGAVGVANFTFVSFISFYTLMFQQIITDN